MLILKLNKQGVPANWISVEHAALYYAKDLVIYEGGSNKVTLRGGIQSKSGIQSVLDINSIISVKGKISEEKKFVPFNRKMLFKRDKCLCAYCGFTYPEDKLEIEHVIPQSKGGKTKWTNVVTACRSCNSRKDDRTPEEAGMKLIYVPYTPNKYETFILANRKILADQMEFLLSGVPKHSRLIPG